MSNLFIIFFSLLPWSSFLFRQTDIWHAEGHFVQISILILFCYSFFEKPKYVQVLNKPLGSFIAWAGLITAYGWITIFSATQHYPVKIVMPFFNLLSLVWLYRLITEYLDSVSIERIFKWLKYSVILLLFYCVLQYLKLDEFLKGINDTGDQLVGTIGNSMHLAGLLAILQPLFFKKSRENILCLILLWLLILLTGSATGLVTGIGVALFWLWFKNRKVAIVASGVSFISLIALHLTHKSFFYNSDRFRVWSLVCKAIKNKFITGFGLGTYGLSGIGDTNVHWQHVHNEYLQVIFEIGIIGLILILWCIWDYFRKFNSLKTDLTIRLASIFFGFCLINYVTFFCHLWLTSTIAMMAYAGIYTIKNEVQNENKT
jgi:O-antigen ligase